MSVVIPTFNAAEFLAEAIASVTGQHARPAEIIIVDDCSTDGTPELARALGASVLSTGVNAGPAAARNLGWRHARGDFVAFLDADDYWEPTHCATLLDLLLRFPQSELAFSRVRTFGGRADVTRAVIDADRPSHATLPLLESNIVPQIAVMVRRGALEAVGGYDEALRYSEDYDLWLRLSERAPFVFSDSITAHYRVHDAQATRAATRLLQGSWDVRLSYLDRARRNLDPSALRAVEERLQRGLERDLQTAWYLGDRALLESTLEICARVPGSRALRERYANHRYLFRLQWALRRTRALIVRGLTRLRHGSHRPGFAR